VELHSVDIEQVFLQADKLMEGVDGRYLVINPSPGRPDPNNKDIQCVWSAATFKRKFLVDKSPT
jgi:hypothetical protein